jgi:hypothetical protein
MLFKSNTILNQWNLLAERFNTHKRRNEVHPDAAVNIHVGWRYLSDFRKSSCLFRYKMFRGFRFWLWYRRNV